jgi:reactive intermediate/imine deaminase
MGRVSTALLSSLPLLSIFACAGSAPVLTRKNPASLSEPNGYTHVVETSGGRTVYVSGQVALDATGALVGTGDLKAQTRQVFENLKAALADSGGTLDDVVKITIFMTDLSQIQDFREIRNGYFPRELPASTLVQVVRLARPDFLIEIEAVAVVRSGG